MAQYIIQKGNTLSGIAFQNKTTVSELLKLNPQIKDPNLIFTGKTLNLPELSKTQTPTPPTTPPTPPPTPTPTPTPTPPPTTQLQTDNQEAQRLVQERLLNQPPTPPQQEKDIKEKIGKNANELQKQIFEQVSDKNIKTSGSLKLIENLVNSFVKNQQTSPEPISLVKLFDSKKAELGIEPLETELSNIDSDIEGINTQLLIEAEKAGERLVSTREIGRRKGTLQQEAQQRISLLQNERNSVARRLDNKLNTLKMTMDFTQQDFSNASAQYSQEFNKNLQMIDLFTQLEQTERTIENQEKNEAQSNLNTIVNLMEKNNKTFNDLTVDQKRNLNILEMQAGLPSGVIEAFVISKPNAEILSTVHGKDKKGDDITTFIYKNPETGKPDIIEIVKTGGVSQKIISKQKQADISTSPTDLFPDGKKIGEMPIKDLKTNIKNKFSKEFANKIILEFNDEQLREFVRDYETVQNKAQQSIDPEIALREWKAVNMLEKKSSSKTATNLSDEEFSDEEIGKLFELGYTSEEILDFENKGISFEKIKK